jgi:hypothetical protein
MLEVFQQKEKKISTSKGMITHFLLSFYLSFLVLPKAVAWDSAGVTTGPVTVPFVLSIGVGFATAVGSSEGFGMLTTMSVAPIISVLAYSALSTPVIAASKVLKRHVRKLSQTISKTFSKRSLEDEEAVPTGKGPRITPSMAIARFAAEQGARLALEVLPEVQRDSGAPPQYNAIRE